MMNKRPWQTGTLLPLTAAVLLTAVTVGRAQAPAQHIDTCEVPLPGRSTTWSFQTPARSSAALDKMGSPPWNSVLNGQSAKYKALDIREEISMLLGVS